MSILSAGTSNTTSLVYTGDTTGNLAFQINGTTEAMRITSGGNVGIGTASPRWDLPFAQNAGRLVDCNSNTANTPSVLAITSVGTDIAARAIISLQNLSQTSGSARMVQIQAERTNASTTALDADFVINISKTGTLTERMRIDSSGRVTTPSQPAFHAVSTSIKEITGSPFIFDTVFFNTGGHYNASNGRFTAPIAGIYYLQMDFLTTNSNTNTVDLRFFKNGAQTQLGTAYYTNYTGGDHRKGFMIALASLNANDYITVQTQSGGSNGNLYGDTNDFGGKGHTAFRAFLMG